MNILNRRGAVISEVDMIDINVAKYVPTFTSEHFKFRAFDFSSGSSTGFWDKVRPVWDAVYREFDDQDAIADWVAALPDDVFLSDGRSFNDVAASFILLLGFASWRSCDHLDDPRRSGISSQLWRSFSDTKAELLGMATGMSGMEADYLLPVSFYYSSNTSRLTDVIDISDSGIVSPSPGMPKTSNYPDYVRRIRSAGQRVTLEWQKLPALLFYPTLVCSAMTNRINRLAPGSELLLKISQQSGDDTFKGISMLDRTLLSLGATLQFRS